MLKGKEHIYQSGFKELHTFCTEGDRTRLALHILFHIRIFHGLKCKSFCKRRKLIDMTKHGRSPVWLTFFQTLKLVLWPFKGR